MTSMVQSSTVSKTSDWYLNPNAMINIFFFLLSIVIQVRVGTYFWKVNLTQMEWLPHFVKENDLQHRSTWLVARFSWSSISCSGLLFHVVQSQVSRSSCIFWSSSVLQLVCILAQLVGLVQLVGTVLCGWCWGVWLPHGLWYHCRFNSYKTVALSVPWLCNSGVLWILVAPACRIFNERRSMAFWPSKIFEAKYSNDPGSFRIYRIPWVGLIHIQVSILQRVIWTKPKNYFQQRSPDKNHSENLVLYTCSNYYSEICFLL